MRNKKGVSEVIASVLLIMLAVVAVLILAAFFTPFVKDNLSESTRCKDVISGVTILPEKEKTCYNSVSSRTNISIRRGNVDIDGIYFAADNILENEKEYIGTAKIPEKGGGHMNYTLTGAFSKIGVGAIIDDKRCPLNEEIEIKKC